MAYEESLTSITIPAGSDLSAKQYYFVKADTDGKAALAGADDQALGILQNDPTAGQAATIAVGGVSKVVASAAINAGARVSATAAGKAVTTTASTVSDGTATGVAGTPVCGIALTPATDDGDVISILVVQAGSLITAVAS